MKLSEKISGISIGLVRIKAETGTLTVWKTHYLRQRVVASWVLQKLANWLRVDR